MYYQLRWKEKNNDRKETFAQFEILFDHSA